MKVLSIHDLSGFGRSSLTTIISILSHLGHQCVPAPTAIFSTHTAISGYVSKDLSDILDDYINHYSSINIDFDAIYSGFLSSSSQIESVINSCKNFPNALVVIDPVMGDDNKIYKTYTPEICNKMKELVKYADIITPNITEAKILLDMDITQTINKKEQVLDIIDLLLIFGIEKIIITGIDFNDDNITTAFYENGQTNFYQNKRINSYFPGTGDLFTSILIGFLLNGHSISESIKKSADFVCESINYTLNLGTNNLFGVEFEKLLPNLK